MRIVVLSDIHGNAWALESVLREVAQVRPDYVLNLGDCFYGPLDPGGTWEQLRRLEWPTVRGNQDRALLGDPETETGRFTQAQIGREGVAWIQEYTRASVSLGSVLACHGDLHHDDVTLIERIEPTHVRSATDAELTDALVGAPRTTDLVLCGHSHQPGSLQLSDGRLVVNPGSVGLPAYCDGLPHPHGMESGTPHARWAIAEHRDDGWQLTWRATPYDTPSAIATARRHGRNDWAEWIATGRAITRP
jgi:putative phosphoesterase